MRSHQSSGGRLNAGAGYECNSYLPGFQEPGAGFLRLRQGLMLGPLCFYTISAETGVRNQVPGRITWDRKRETCGRNFRASNIWPYSLQNLLSISRNNRVVVASTSRQYERMADINSRASNSDENADPGRGDPGRGDFVREDSVRDKCLREVELLQSAGQGIAHEAAETLRHPETRLPEVGMGLAAGAVLGILTHGRFGVAGAVSTAFGSMFIKQALSDGGNVLGAASDAWDSPNHMKQNDEVVAHTIGNFAMDTAAFSIGGIAGSKLARLPFTIRMETRLQPDSLRGIEAGSLQLPVESKSMNISYDKPETIRPSTAIADSARGDAELRTLLGYEQPSDVKFLKTSHDTTYGTAQLRSHFMRSDNSLLVTLETTNQYNPPQMEVKLNGDGHPVSVQVKDDGARVLPSLFERLNMPHLAEATGGASGEFALAEKFGKVDAVKAKSELTLLRSASGAPLRIDETLQGSAEYVPQKSAGIAPITQALGTTDIATCTGLAVIDEAGGKHFLAHTDHVTNPDLLRRSLAQFDLTKSQIYILEGAGNAFSAGMNVAGSAERILAALGNDRAVLRNVHFLEYGGPNSNANLVIHGGKLYADATGWG